MTCIQRSSLVADAHPSGPGDLQFSRPLQRSSSASSSSESLSPKSALGPVVAAWLPAMTGAAAETGWNWPSNTSSQNLRRKFMNRTKSLSHSPKNWTTISTSSPTFTLQFSGPSTIAPVDPGPHPVHWVQVLVTMTTCGWRANKAWGLGHRIQRRCRVWWMKLEHNSEDWSYYHLVI